MAVLGAMPLLCMLEVSSTEEQVQGAPLRCISTINVQDKIKGVPGHLMDTPSPDAVPGDIIWYRAARCPVSMNV